LWTAWAQLCLLIWGTTSWILLLNKAGARLEGVCGGAFIMMCSCARVFTKPLSRRLPPKAQRRQARWGCLGCFVYCDLDLWTLFILYSRFEESWHFGSKCDMHGHDVGVTAWVGSWEASIWTPKGAISYGSAWWRSDDRWYSISVFLSDVSLKSDIKKFRENIWR
jgi:hypothetical protein